MIYEAPYSAWYVSGAGNTLQLLNLWDATPEPPRFGGDIEVFETSLWTARGLLRKDWGLP